ncbi:unnamed protein product [Hermetia illucens]|uniref:Uncharacterized protein n=1 Tax=Hermetia illucens TaxID=343691 RepID=A0A7R8U9H1_HERIL|nr:uncharacterized protein LOC119661193 [Hermetia illucens]CAD7076599.1 unnamed protein product [Hermetia illucens]
MNLRGFYAFIVVLLICGVSAASVSRVVHIDANTGADKGFWRKKVIWKPRMVKDWEERRYVVGIWKKVWGPVEVKEWVPFPKPLPSW